MDWAAAILGDMDVKATLTGSRLSSGLNGRYISAFLATVVPAQATKYQLGSSGPIICPEITSPWRARHSFLGMARSCQRWCEACASILDGARSYPRVLRRNNNPRHGHYCATSNGPGVSCQPGLFELEDSSTREPSHSKCYIPSLEKEMESRSHCRKSFCLVVKQFISRLMS
jgi:hypothetical protein